MPSRTSCWLRLCAVWVADMPLLLPLLAVVAMGVSQRWAVYGLHSVALRILRNRRWAHFWLWMLLFPGLVLHEVGHWLAAKLLGVPCGRMSLFALGKGYGSSLRLGYMEVGRVDPVRNALVAMAPLAMGLLVLAIVSAKLDLLPTSLIPAALFAQLWSVAARPWQPLDFLGLYLIFAISVGSMPSQADLTPARWLLVGTVALAVVADVLGWTHRLPTPLEQGLAQVAGRVAAAALTAALLNVAVATAVGIVDAVIGLVLPRRVRS